MRLADLKPSHQLAHLKQAVPEEAKCLLYQHEVDSVEHALEILTELYEPLKDSSTLMKEILKLWTHWSWEYLIVPLQIRPQGINCGGTGWRWHWTKWSNRPNSEKTLEAVSHSSPRSRWGWQTSQMCKQTEELQKQIASLQAGKKGLSRPEDAVLLAGTVEREGTWLEIASPARLEMG